MASSELKIEYNTDLKQILLGENYDKVNPIKNILLAKKGKNYQNKSSDYYNYTSYKNGHIENYQIVEEVFQKLNGGKPTEYKDIMNSFWVTYKTILQIEYPEFFRPNRIEKILEKPDKNTLLPPSIKYPPYCSRKNLIISDEYRTYFEAFNFGNNEKFKIEEEDTWLDFLLKNFGEFEKVHKNPNLMKFAELTHTIGNITIVPKGFNRSRASHDYWDFALESLRVFLASFNSWNNYVEIYCMQPFLKEDGELVSLWEGHLEGETPLLLQDKDMVNEFLVGVNKSIEVRGKNIIEKLERIRKN